VSIVLVLFFPCFIFYCSSKTYLQTENVPQKDRHGHARTIRTRIGVWAFFDGRRAEARRKNKRRVIKKKSVIVDTSYQQAERNTHVLGYQKFQKVLSSFIIT